MARVLCISSQTVFGPVGNSAAVPALQARGHEVMQIPTVLLSNHPGLGKPAGQSSSVDLINSLFEALTQVNAFTTLDAVMTGYFSSSEQVMAVAKHIASLKSQHPNLHVLVDPVMGDHGKLYVGEDAAAALRDALLPLATITTPNLFELTWLTGHTDVREAVAKLAIAETIVTSLPEDQTHLATELYAAGQKHHHRLQRFAKVPNGTGDFLAGCYLAERLLREPQHAFANTMQRVETAITKSLNASALTLS
jgi:pyridoxine kinase